MKKIWNLLLDLVYKKKCYFCGKSKYSVKMCPDCFAKLSYNEVHVNRIIDGVNVYACAVYEKTLQKLIRGLKYHKQKELAYYLAKFMHEYFIQIGTHTSFQVIPVPQHKNRLKKRKYNHMELVAEEFCKLSGFQPNYDLLKRIKDTKPQYKLNRQQRLKNLENAFSVKKEKDLFMPVLVIDDICTTGTTMEEIIKTLKQAGIKEIVCFTASIP